LSNLITKTFVPTEASGLVHTTPEEFENGDFALKMQHTFSLQTTPEEFENATITGHLGFVFEENSVREIT